MVTENRTFILDKYINSLLIIGKMDEWKVIEEICMKQIKVREEAMKKVVVTEEDKAQHNILYGEILGINTIMKLPQIAMQKAEDEKIMDEFKKQKENNHGPREQGLE